MDMTSKADKIASARKLLKSYQQKKNSSSKTAAPLNPQFTMLTESSPSTLAEGIDVPGETHVDQTQSLQSQTSLQNPAAPLPVFTFPTDGSASFSEYMIGGPVGAPLHPPPPAAAAEPAPPTIVSSAEKLPAEATTCTESPVAVSAAGTSESPVAVSAGGTSEPPVAVSACGTSEPPVAVSAGGTSESPVAASDDSPPGASMASSFTFAGSQLSGTGSQGSAASSRHSDWEYVGSQPEQEPARQQGVADAAAVAADPVSAPTAHLTSETLRQLSDRLSQMTSDDGDASGAAAPAAPLALEARNLELATAVESERRARLHAQTHLEDLRVRVSELEQEQEEGRRAADHRLEQEQARLAEQARVQAQTIGILVAEKTELKTAADLLQTQLAEKTGECDSLSGRLSAAEATVRQLQEQTSRADQIEVSVQHLQSLYAQADNERNRNRELCSELQEELDEARQRLRAQLDANQALTRQLADANSRLELAEIRLTQLGAGGAAHDADAAARRAEERAESAAREADQLRTERDAAAVQFREYTAALAARLQEAEAARDRLAAELAARPEAEPAPAPAAVEAPSQPPVEAVPVTDAERQELQQLRQAVQRAEEETDTLRRELRALSEQNTQLAVTGQQQAAALHEMEVTVERVSSSAVDNSQLVREMESDRVAASRAMAQNKQLKQQLQELQDGFITLSNKKLELTESLAAERQTAAERSQQLAEVQQQLEKTAARAMEADQQNMTAHQMIDQLRHWEALGRHAETLQADLAAAEEKLSRLQSPDAAPDAAPAGSEDVSAPAPEGQQTPRLSPVPRPPVEEVVREREELRARLQQCIGEGAVDPAEHKRVRSALAQLEVRFCEVMNQVAVLKEERQALEHLCEQLQGETDTIGEYISLYQVQRSALKQQAQERQQELNTLHEDRQQLRQQLSQLQRLVSQLMAGQQAPNPAATATAAATAAVATVVGTAPSGGMTPASVPAVTPTPAADSGSSSPAESVAPVESGSAREQTARRIISLIEQIGANEYVEGHAAPLHVCQHCRGKRVLNV